MVPFGGWDMPVQYPAGIIESHLHCRKSAGLFDVSHMLGVVLRGAHRVEFMEKLCCADLKALPEGMGTLTVITNEAGGVIDDCIVTNAGDHLYMVINAGHEEKDLPHIAKHMKEFVSSGGDVSMETLADNGILALQGPKAVDVLQRFVPFDLKQMPFMSAKSLPVRGIECFVSRSGYTGEDGFEIAVPKGNGAEHGVITLWEEFLSQEEVLPVGLGARDSLRLEAGLCLYGNDLDDTTTPVEGSLQWVIAKRRRNEPGSFVGSDVILEQLASKSTSRKRVGFTVKGAPVREGTPILSSTGEEVGVVTSGSFSPNLKTGIGMCYVKPPVSKIGTELEVLVRNKKQTITIAKMPFVTQNYYRGP